MLSTARVSIPSSVQSRLKTEASFADNVHDYAREDLIGFKRPIAAVFALMAPITCALGYYNGGITSTVLYGLFIIALVGAGIYFAGKRAWPSIVDAFQEGTNAKRKAVADLRCGFGESYFLSQGRTPRYYEYEHGVIILTDAGDLKTMFFDIQKSDADRRWSLYKNGNIHRRIWRWVRLPVSREIVEFTCEGSKMVRKAKSRKISSIEVFEAVNLCLGEPMDGEIIHRPFDELTDAVDRLT